MRQKELRMVILFHYKESLKRQITMAENTGIQMSSSSLLSKITWLYNHRIVV